MLQLFTRRLLHLQREQNESHHTRAKSRPVSTARSRAKRCAEEWFAKNSNTGPNGSPVKWEHEFVLQLHNTSARGLPRQADLIESTIKATFSDG